MDEYLYTALLERLAIFQSPLFPARESLVSDIQAIGTEKSLTFFLQCVLKRTFEGLFYNLSNTKRFWRSFEVNFTESSLLGQWKVGGIGSASIINNYVVYYFA